MTSKLKCPFCQKGLSQGYNHDRDTVFYHCNNCYFQGDGIIWIALIQAKQDLEIARKAFEDIDMLLHSRKFDITELGRLNIVQHLVSRVLKLTEHKE